LLPRKREVKVIIEWLLLRFIWCTENGLTSSKGPISEKETGNE
jgi:hypothetical protein